MSGESAWIFQSLPCRFPEKCDPQTFWDVAPYKAGAFDERAQHFQLSGSLRGGWLALPPACCSLGAVAIVPSHWEDRATSPEPHNTNSIKCDSGKKGRAKLCSQARGSHIRAVPANGGASSAPPQTRQLPEQPGRVLTHQTSETPAGLPHKAQQGADKGGF